MLYDTYSGLVTAGPVHELKHANQPMSKDVLPTPVPASIDFQAVFDAAPGLYLVIYPNDPVYTIATVNRAYAQATLTRAEDITGRGLFEVFPDNPGDPEASGVRILTASLRRVLSTKKPDTLPPLKYDIRRPEGGGFEERYWSALNTPVIGAGGSIEFIIHRVEDVTEFVRLQGMEAEQGKLAGELAEIKRLKHADEKLEQANLRNAENLEGISDGFFALDPEWRFVYVNSAAESLLGARREALIGGNFWNEYPPIKGTIAESEYRRAMTERVAVEFEVFYDPWGKWYSIRAFPTLQGGLSVYFREISEQKRAETALRQSEERYRFLAESMPQMVWTATPDGALNYVSGQVTAYFAMAAEDLLGAGWLQGVHPDDRAFAVERWRHSIETGEPYEFEFRLRRGEDGEWRWFLVRALSMAAEGQRVERWVGTCTDIHDQKQGETALRRANRELEEFAYVASHDLQEPLRMVNIYTHLLLRRLPDHDPEIAEFAGFVRDGVLRMEKLILDLLSFSHIVHTDHIPSGKADLQVSLDQALSVLSNRVTESGAAIVADPLPVVMGDAAQLASVFQNLISNSMKYRKTNRTPEIRISAKRDRGDWIVTVRDNGIGFEQQYAERIFGLFKRLHKEEYPGTGLGLAICQRIIERYGGRIWAESEPGKGSAFSFALPEAVIE